jgi:hypothetical protein
MDIPLLRNHSKSGEKKQKEMELNEDTSRNMKYLDMGKTSEAPKCDAV